MYLSISDEHVDLVAQSEIANPAWEALKAIHADQQAARRLNLRKQLTNLSTNPSENMIGYIMRAKHIRASLKAIDGTITKFNKLMPH